MTGPLRKIDELQPYHWDLRMDKEVRANVEEESLLRVQLVQDDEQDYVIDDGKHIPLDALELEVERLDQLLAVAIGTRRISAVRVHRYRLGLSSHIRRLGICQIAAGGNAKFTALNVFLINRFEVAAICADLDGRRTAMGGAAKLTGARIVVQEIFGFSRSSHDDET